MKYKWPTTSLKNLEVESSDPSEPKLRRSKRTRKKTINSLDDFYTFLVDDDPRSYKEAMNSSYKEAMNSSYKESMNSPDAPLWKKAINSEIESIMHNHMWEIVDLPPGTKTIGYKGIFKKKLKPYGSIEKYKARLVAKGFKQKKGID